MPASPHHSSTGANNATSSTNHHNPDSHKSNADHAASKSTSEAPPGLGLCGGPKPAEGALLRVGYVGLEERIDRDVIAHPTRAVRVAQIGGWAGEIAPRWTTRRFRDRTDIPQDRVGLMLGPEVLRASAVAMIALLPKTARAVRCPVTMATARSVARLKRRR